MKYDCERRVDHAAGWTSGSVACTVSSSTSHYEADEQLPSYHGHHGDEYAAWSTDTTAPVEEKVEGVEEVWDLRVGEEMWDVRAERTEVEGESLVPVDHPLEGEEPAHEGVLPGESPRGAPPMSASRATDDATDGDDDTFDLFGVSPPSAAGPHWTMKGPGTVTATDTPRANTYAYTPSGERARPDHGFAGLRNQ